MTMQDGLGLGLATNGAHAMIKADPATAALQAQAQASIQTRYFMAQHNPRSWDAVRHRVLQSCTRRGFAESAVYAKPVGRDKIRGPSVRLAEEFFRAAGNISIGAETVYEDVHKRVVRVTAIDLETNAIAASDVSVEKTLERREPKDRTVIAQRQNSTGAVVYIVAATDDELAVKTNALVSKARRNLILQLIPSDLVEEAVAQCQATSRGDAKDASAARKKLCDSFAAVGVLARDLEEYLGHGLAAMHPDEIVELREIYASLKDGETKWGDVLAAKLGVADATTAAAETKKGKASLADKIRAKAEPAPAETVDARATTEPAPAEAPPVEREREPGEG